MSERPKEIWCDTGLYWEYKTGWSEGSWRDNDNCGGEKYVRADRIEELEAKLARAMDALAGVDQFVRDLSPFADPSHSPATALAKACEVYAELTGGKDE